MTLKFPEQRSRIQIYIWVVDYLNWEKNVAIMPDGITYWACKYIVKQSGSLTS